MSRYLLIALPSALSLVVDHPCSDYAVECDEAVEKMSDPPGLAPPSFVILRFHCS